MNLRSKCEEIRRTVLQLSFHARSAHVGSSLSCVEALAAIFALKRETKEFGNSTVILSKGHAAMALYATAIEFGELSREVVPNYLKDGTSLWGHPSVSEVNQFIQWSTGSLGHGFPVASGIAYARTYLKKDERPVVVILSDGELDEGSNWEAALFAAHHKLANLTVIVDYNKIQSFGRCDEVMSLEPLADKWRSFGWDVQEVDGHDAEKMSTALLERPLNQPRVVIAHTVKGRGVGEYEDRLESHYRPVSAEMLKKYEK